MPRQSKPINCTEEERQALVDMSLDEGNARIAKRAHMVLDLMEGKTITVVAAEHSERQNTVIKWRDRVIAHGSAGLLNLPRGNSCSTYGPDFMERLLQLANSAPPEGAHRWTIALLATHMQATTAAVKRYLRKAGVTMAMINHPKTGSDAVAEALREASACDLSMADQDAASASDEHPESRPEQVGTADISGDTEAEAAPAAGTTAVLQGVSPVMRQTQPGRLSLAMTFQLIDENGNVYHEGSTLVANAMADATNFNMDTVSGFRHDFNEYEKSLFGAFTSLSQNFSSGLMDEFSKKNGN